MKPETKLTFRKAIKVNPTDKRSPMLRLLADCTLSNGHVEVEYDQQWRTLFKAERLGFVNADMYITESGKKFVADRKSL